MIENKIKVKLVNYLRQKVSNPEDREDILQECLLIVLGKRGTVTGSVEAYVYGICRNKIREYYRHKRQVSRIIQSFQDPEDSEPEYFSTEFLKQLSDFEQLLIQERFYHKKSLKEIAQTLNTNYATLRWQMSQLLTKIRQLLVKEDENGLL